MFDIDYVFPWVNNAEKVWRKTFIDYCKKNQLEWRLAALEKERYRDWGLLKYLFRAIAKNMPWIHKVHLIVSNIEQVPAWINQQEVHIVLHEDFMPQQCLPTFNSTTIEMFLPKIPDLAEHFIYGNDDMYPMAPSQPSDWYNEEGKPCFNMLPTQRKAEKDKQFRKVCCNQWDMLCRLTKHLRTECYERPQHGLVPLLTSKCNEVLELIGDTKILNSTSRFRLETNMNQYIYSDYLELCNYRSDNKLNFKYVGAKHPLDLLTAITNTEIHNLCINDCNNNLTPMQLTTLQVLCAQEFEKRFPEKCKYEN